jgi:hypothetical protein
VEQAPIVALSAVLGGAAAGAVGGIAAGWLRRRTARTDAAVLLGARVGLAARLLGIGDAEAMGIHPMRGALFENMLIGEYLKHLRHRGLAHAPYFWRDNIGNKIDLRIESAPRCGRWRRSPERPFRAIGCGACTPGSATRRGPVAVRGN